MRRRPSGPGRLLAITILVPLACVGLSSTSSAATTPSTTTANFVIPADRNNYPVAFTPFVSSSRQEPTGKTSAAGGLETTTVSATEAPAVLSDSVTSSAEAAVGAEKGSLSYCERSWSAKFRTRACAKRAYLQTLSSGGTVVGSAKITTVWATGIEKGVVSTVVVWNYSEVKDLGYLLVDGYARGHFTSDGSGFQSFQKLDSTDSQGVSKTPIPVDGVGKNVSVDAKWDIAYGNDARFNQKTINTYQMPITRCDTIVTTSSGCVLPRVAAYLDVTRNPSETSRYSAHVLKAVASGLPGGYGTGFYLHRLQNKVLSDKNRDTSCPARITNNNPGTPGKLLDCDEYPFATTHAGAFTSQTSADHPARSFDSINCKMPDPARTGGQGFSRCWIPKADNELGGSYYGAFLQKERLIDPDNSTLWTRSEG